MVDDNEDAAELLAALVEQLGNTTRVANDADAALQILEDFTPDLAILDIGLPVMDGYELARRIRARMPNHNLQLVALTGFGQDSDRANAESAGFNAHLVKPVAMDTLRALIANAPSS